MYATWRERESARKRIAAKRVCQVVMSFSVTVSPSLYVGLVGVAVVTEQLGWLLTIVYASYLLV